MDDDLLLDADVHLSEAERHVEQVRRDLPDVDHDTRRELASVVTLLRRVKRRIPATLAAA